MSRAGASESKPFAVLGDLDDVNRREMLRGVVGWLHECGQQLGDDQFGQYYDNTLENSRG